MDNILAKSDLESTKLGESRTDIETLGKKQAKNKNS